MHGTNSDICSKTKRRQISQQVTSILSQSHSVPAAGDDGATNHFVWLSKIISRVINRPFIDRSIFDILWWYITVIDMTSTDDDDDDGAT